MAHSVSEQTRRRLNVLLSRVKSCCESLESVRLDLTKQASLNQRVAEALEQAGLAEVHHLAQQKVRAIPNSRTHLQRGARCQGWGACACVQGQRFV
jgi:hypothetical protein